MAQASPARPRWFSSDRAGFSRGFEFRICVLTARRPRRAGPEDAIQAIGLLRVKVVAKRQGVTAIVGLISSKNPGIEIVGPAEALLMGIAKIPMSLKDVAGGLDVA